MWEWSGIRTDAAQADNIMSTDWSQLKDFYSRMEIAFWDLLIRVMRESKVLQKALCAAHALLSRNRWFWRIPPNLRWATTGLGCGFLIGSISAIF